MVTAMLCAGAVMAQFVGGKATRDALFLASLDFTALPAVVIATSVFSIVLVVVNSRVARRVSPRTLVPASFAVSGVLFFVEWFLTGRTPKAAAIIAYLHISGAGPLLGSGFWLISTERFDPHTAKQRFGQIASAGTFGGLLAAALAERVAGWFDIAAMLPILGALHLASAYLVRQLAIQTGEQRRSAGERLGGRAQPSELSGWRLLLGTTYLRQLAVLVLLGTTGAALLDYVFKAEAVRTFGRGDNLLRFFAAYYAGTSLLTFVVQATSSRVVLERYGLALATATPSIALMAGGFVGLIAPGFTATLTARAGESVFRGSLYRAGYELFYTPFPAAERRAAKSIVDVGFDRLGDAVGGGLVRMTLFLAPVAAQYPAILGLAIICSAVAIVAASSLNRGYVSTLERSLLDRAVEIDLSDVEDATTRTLMTRTLELGKTTLAGARPAPRQPIAAGGSMTSLAIDPEVQDILRLRSGDRDRVAEVLRNDDGLSATLVPHAIPLLAWDPVAKDALFALRKIAEEHVGQLVDALIDPNQDFAVRRRLARVFSVCVSQRAVDGVMLGLDDLRFEVRYHCAHSLSSIVEKNPLVRIDGERIMTVVLREAAVGRPMWESRRLLDEFEPFEGASFVDEFVRDRAGQSLAHVFTLLSLVLPREPLQIAFRSLQTDDRQLQGTALEYLEGVLPVQIRRRLWPFLEDRRPAARPERPREQILADLLRSNQSIMLNLEELKRRAANESGTTGVQSMTREKPGA
jgi:AAA family ATP:ADP antiporter